MSVILSPNRKTVVVGRNLIAFPPANPPENQETDQVQEAIWRLQGEVKRLQEELVRTRRALDQREVLLRNSQQRERELRAEGGVR